VAYSCFEEIKRILEAIRVRYTNAFDESKADDEEDIIDDPASDLFDTLQAMRTAPEPKRLQATAQLKPQVERLLAILDEKECPPEMKKELLAAIKKAANGSIPEYFEAMKILEETLNKAKAMQPQPLQIAMGNMGIRDRGGPMDLLEAAKRMCAALSSLNITLDS